MHLVQKERVAPKGQSLHKGASLQIQYTSLLKVYDADMGICVCVCVRVCVCVCMCCACVRLRQHQ